MLIKYAVSNYKSIGHRIEIDMFPAKTNADSRFTKTISTPAGQWTLLHRAGFFGPNASGKSALIESIDFARSFILDGRKVGRGTGIVQHKGEFPDLNGQSLFQFTFLADETVYEYGFSIDPSQVHEEWLYVLSKNDFVPLYTRVTDALGKTTVDITSKLARKNSKERNLIDALKEGLQEKQKNQLFLYKLYDNGVKKIEPIIDWFEHLQIIFPHSNYQGLPIKLLDNDFHNFMTENMKSLDTGVFDFTIMPDEIAFDDCIKKYNFSSEDVKFMEENGSGIVSTNGEYFIFSLEEKTKHIAILQIKFDHQLNGRHVLFNMEDESDGTQRLIDLLPILFIIKKNIPTVFFVDELDRSLHTKLSQYLLNQFMCYGENANAQIIFTAHDVNLINLDRFRQEELWFLEKNHVGESTLRPLSDFNLKEGQDILKSYLGGRFGAIPVIRGV